MIRICEHIYEEVGTTDGGDIEDILYDIECVCKKYTVLDYFEQIAAIYISDNDEYYVYNTIVSDDGEELGGEIHKSLYIDDVIYHLVDVTGVSYSEIANLIN